MLNHSPRMSRPRLQSMIDAQHAPEHLQRENSADQGALFPEIPVESWLTVKVSEVSSNSKHLLKIIKHQSRKRGYCFAKIEKLTQWMQADRGVPSTRQIQRYIRELKDRGLLQVKKGCQNFYFPLSPDDAHDNKRDDKMSSPMSS